MVNENEESPGNDVFLLLAGVVDSPDTILDEGLLLELLATLPAEIGMNALSEPIIAVARGNPGLEGYVPIDMSNITVSTYDNNNRVVACIHSCREFDFTKALSIFRQFYQCSKIQYRLVLETDLEKDFK